MSAATLHRKLERLIGKHFAYRGERWVLIEVLADIDSLVLQRCAASRRANVQNNSYGQPTRRVEGMLTLPLSDAATGGYSPEVLTLLAGTQKA